MKKVKKAIIPAAGLGTRFLPATKTVPKEMLTIVDAPIILYVVEEAIRAGIEDIVLIAGRGKTAIEDFFDFSYELEDKLAKDGKEHLLERVAKARSNANIISLRQKQPLGLGHAVLCGAPVTGDEPFAVLLGDEIMISESSTMTATEQLVAAFNKSGLSTVAVMEVPDKDVSKYGIVESSPINPSLFKVSNVIEKPQPKQTSSRWALPGRYVFTAKLMEYLRDTAPGVNGEIQLTDAMTRLAQNEGLHASTFTAERFDAGDKLGYLQANVELALRNPELASGFKSYLFELVDRLKKDLK